jgi:hypothetical protein
MLTRVEFYYYMNGEETFESGTTTNDIISEFAGFTTEVDGTINSHGEVTRVMFSIPFRNVKSSPPGSISVNGPWKAHFMGTTSNSTFLIALSSPNVISITKSHCTVVFTLATPYPSNSPCYLVYGNSTSKITIPQIV